MFVWRSLCISVCMLTVSNALLMASATAIVRSGGLFWLSLLRCCCLCCVALCSQSVCC